MHVYISLPFLSELIIIEDQSQLKISVVLVKKKKIAKIKIFDPLLKIQSDIIRSGKRTK